MLAIAVIFSLPTSCGTGSCTRITSISLEGVASGRNTHFAAHLFALSLSFFCFLVKFFIGPPGSDLLCQLFMCSSISFISFTILSHYPFFLPSLAVVGPVDCLILSHTSNSQLVVVVLGCCRSKVFYVIANYARQKVGRKPYPYPEP